MCRSVIFSTIAGAAAGAVNGLFGAGGGMVLVPLLSCSKSFSEREIFASSVPIILPVCISSLLFSSGGALPWSAAWPFLLGGIPGGILASTLGRRIGTKWLHRILGCLIIYGGVRYLC